MTKENNILDFIRTIRESFGASIAVYTCGNCYQFYEILKRIYPDAKAYETGGHVYTKIGENYYDIRGKLTEDFKLIPITEEERIKSLSVNKWTDKRRIEYAQKYKNK